MKVTRIQHSLKDLNKDIGNCERQLSRVLRDNHSNSASIRIQNASAKNTNIKPGYRQTSVSHLTRTGLNPTIGNQKAHKSRSPSRSSFHQDKNVICKEIIGDKYAPTRVEVVVRTQSCKKRSRSVQANRTDHEIPTKDFSSKSKNYNQKEMYSSATQGRKSTSWGHLLQQQNSSCVDSNWTHEGREKVCAALHYSSTDDDHSSAELEKWVQSIPPEQSKSSHRSSRKITVSGNMKKSGTSENYASTFNPLRTLNFLVKELRGKVNKNYDENMQRIIEDMEKALCCIPLDIHASQLPHSAQASAVLNSQFHNNHSRSKISLGNAYDVDNSASKATLKTASQEQLRDITTSSNLVKRLMSTVSRITKIPGMAEDTQGSSQFSDKLKQVHANVLPAECATSDLQDQLELGCKQLEETCRQMEETCENLRRQKSQLLDELKHKTRQIDSAVGKNHQLTVYAADIRQEMCHIRQSAERALQEHEKVKQKLLSQQQELQQSNQRLNQRLEETIQENERLSTELQLSHLEKNKMHILLSNKDLEIAKLKKDIVDINTLVTEQLANLQCLSGKKSPAVELDTMMKDVCRLSDTVDTFAPNDHCFKDGFKNHIGDGEGSRSRPICSSPTSSVNSSLYSSWQLMSDIAATEQNFENETEKEKSALEIAKETISKRDKDSGINTDTPIDMLHQERANSAASKISESENVTREKCANELKAGLKDLLHVLKKQTSEVVNITLPSPLRGYDRMQETLGVSQWTELSASETTVLFHSNDSDSDDLS